MKHDVVTVKLSKQVSLQYVEQGDYVGIPLILLHGYVDSWHSFERVLPHIPKYIHAFVLTERGHGDSSRPVIGYRTSDFVKDLAEFMDLLGLRTSVIVGCSSGGIIARRYAIEYPGRISGLILAGSPLTFRDKPSVLELWDSTISKLEDPIDPKFVRGFMISTLAQKVPQSFLNKMLKENLKVPARVWKATLKGLLRDNSSKELNKIKVPTLIIWGDKDMVTPRSDQKTLLEQIEGSRLIVYPGAGHTFYWEEPIRFASDVVAFINNIKS
jgi:non-heme chloroperoxidase